VAVISETMARRYWPDREAIGRDFRLRFDGEPWRVIGVVADYKVNTPGETPKPYIHLPLRRNDTVRQLRRPDAACCRAARTDARA
jgi:hypothetical protein